MAYTNILSVKRRRPLYIENEVKLPVGGRRKQSPYYEGLRRYITKKIVMLSHRCCAFLPVDYGIFLSVNHSIAYLSCTFKHL